MKEQYRGPVIVIAPHDAVVVFPTAEALLHDLERMDVGGGARSRYFGSDGAELRVVQERGVTIIAGDRPRNGIWDEEIDEDALRATANEVLRMLWLGRFPRKPRSLHRLVHGKNPPTL